MVRNNVPAVLLEGYHNRPELTLEKFRNLWWHTGDAGYVDDDGYLYFLGRQDEVIRRGGENVSPADVEQVLVQHPLVDEVAVVGVPDPDLGQEIMAVVVPLEGFDPHRCSRSARRSCRAWPGPATSSSATRCPRRRRTRCRPRSCANAAATSSTCAHTRARE